MIIHPGMLQVSSRVHFRSRLMDFLWWVFPCLKVSQEFICLYKYNGFQESRNEDTVQSMLGDVFNQVSMGLPTQEDIKFFLEKDIK